MLTKKEIESIHRQTAGMVIASDNEVAGEATLLGVSQNKDGKTRILTSAGPAIPLAGDWRETTQKVLISIREVGDETPIKLRWASPV